MSHTRARQRRLFDATDGRPRPFFISKHDSTHLHYDLRLQHAGVLKSWALNTGPCLDVEVRREAVLVDDHALKHGPAEWPIQKASGQGAILLWDQGMWETDQDFDEAFHYGQLMFRLRGQKLKGLWSLTLSPRRRWGQRERWDLKKECDEEARSLSEMDILAERPESVLTGKTLEEVALEQLPSVPAKRGAKRGRGPMPNQLSLFADGRNDKRAA